MQLRAKVRLNLCFLLLLLQQRVPRTQQRAMAPFAMRPRVDLRRLPASRRTAQLVPGPAEDAPSDLTYFK